MTSVQLDLFPPAEDTAAPAPATFRLPTLADDDSLVESLRFAVPLRLAELLALPARDRAIRAQWWMRDAARIVGERGDLLQFADPRPTANLRLAGAFEHLARGLAGLVVTSPEGVEFVGLHWCVNTTCSRCYPPRREPAMTLAEINAELERLDGEYRQLAGLPPWQPPAEPARTAPARIPRQRRHRTITTVHLEGVS